MRDLLMRVVERIRKMMRLRKNKLDPIASLKSEIKAEIKKISTRQ